MQNTIKPIIVLSAIICLLMGCKKDKLTNDFKELVGSWSTITTMGEIGNCGYVMGTWTNPNFQLTIIEKGRYKLYGENKTIEKGRLIIKNGFVTFATIEKQSVLKNRNFKV